MAPPREALPVARVVRSGRERRGPGSTASSVRACTMYARCTGSPVPKPSGPYPARAVRYARTCGIRLTGFLAFNVTFTTPNTRVSHTDCGSIRKSQFEALIPVPGGSPRGGDVGFPIRFGGVSYTIRILLYLDVSCGVS